MIIEPAIRENICLNAHPVGCAVQVQEQVDYVKQRGPVSGPKRVLVIGASNGYGLAARIVSTFGTDADTIGLAFERGPRAKRTGSAGWYNNEAFQALAEAEGRGAWTLNGDAFTNEIKEQVRALIREHLGQLDLLVYSIAAPRRKDPVTEELYSSVIKPIGEPYTATTMDFQKGTIKSVTAAPATEAEIAHTVKVMGGEDWALWINTLQQAGVLAPGFQTLAFSYIGPESTKAIYRDGTIGKAKEDLEQTVVALNEQLTPLGGQAHIGVMKALVTRASAVIPAVPLYISLLYQVMKKKELHENCIMQLYRLYRDVLFTGREVPVDDQGRIRLDDWEMRPDVQQEVVELWQQVTNDNIAQLADIEGFRAEFLHHHGFGIPEVDYAQDVTLVTVS
ncbi:enoyl-ACP reductase FabV [Planctomycetota bacterium]